MESADGHVMGVPGELTIVANSQLTDKPITRYNFYNLSTRYHKAHCSETKFNPNVP